MIFSRTFAAARSSVSVGSTVIIDAALLFSTSTVATVSSDKMQRLREPVGYQAERPEFHCGG
jgi:hypothetical protein